MASEAIANQIFRQLRNDRGTTEVATYVAVPGNEMARWLLPAAVPEIARVLASWAPYRWWSRVGWAACIGKETSEQTRTIAAPDPEETTNFHMRCLIWASALACWIETAYPKCFLPLAHCF